MGFQPIDEERVRKSAIKAKGGSGSSGMDAEGNTNLLKAYLQKSSKDYVRTRKKLIPLYKNPDFRPIGIREVLKRVVGELIVSLLKKDAIKATGSFV